MELVYRNFRYLGTNTVTPSKNNTSKYKLLFKINKPLIVSSLKMVYVIAVLLKIN